MKREISTQIQVSVLLGEFSEPRFTEMPIVRENSFLTEKAVLLNVPLTNVGVRTRLRLYDPDATGMGRVKVRFFRDATLLGERSILLETFGPAAFSPHPGFSELAIDVATIPELRDEPLVRVEVVPESAGLRFWGFASVTYNSTQHIRLITPQ